jgi:anti-sigma factor RsiW
MSSDVRLWEENEEPLVRYLLGNVSPGEQAEIEDRLFVEEDFHDRMRAAGDDLIDAYLAGSLPPEDKARFEAHFLASPRRRARFELVRDIVSAVQESAAEAQPAERAVPLAAKPRRIPRWALAAALLVAAAGLVIALRRPAPPLPPLTTTPIPPASDVSVVRLGERSGQPVEIALASRARTLRLQAPVPDDRHPTFVAVLRSTDGAPVWQARDLVPSGPDEPLDLTVPAALLVADRYELSIEGETLRGVPPRKKTTLTYTLRIYRQSP